MGVASSSAISIFSAVDEEEEEEEARDVVSFTSADTEVSALIVEGVSSRLRART